MLYFAVLYIAILYNAMLYSAMLYHAIPCYTIHCYHTLYGTHPPGVTTDSVRFRSGGSMGDFGGHDACRRRRDEGEDERRVKKRSG